MPAYKNTYKRLVKHFGGQDAAATALGVDQSAVSRWVRGHNGMSPSLALRAERVTGGEFSRRDLAPAFPWHEFDSLE